MCLQRYYDFEVYSNKYGPSQPDLSSIRLVVSTMSHFDNLSGVSDLETNLAAARGERCLGRSTIIPGH